MSVRILQGDCLSRLRELSAGSVHCCITSPPYWGLRSYKGDPGMIGLEPTFEEHLVNLVVVFREVRRVLRNDGILWLNYGDAYAGSWGNYHPTGKGGQREKETERWDRPAYKDTGRRPPASRPQNGLKPKDLMMMPARVAMALQADGWWLRSEIIWHKPNPMPESVTDRPTSAHEKLFLLAKSAKYFYDAESVRVATPETQRLAMTKTGRMMAPPKGEDDLNTHKTWKQKRSCEEQAAMGANLRNVWKIATHSFSEAHFATFPPRLVEPCIRAGTSERGCCAECGGPWVRVVDVSREYSEWAKSQRFYGKGGSGSEWSGGGTNSATVPPKHTTIGWKPTCSCDADTRPCTVLDPFAGSGTVGLVAQRLQRDAILIEVSPDYVKMARKRIGGDMPLLSKVEVE